MTNFVYYDWWWVIKRKIYWLFIDYLFIAKLTIVIIDIERYCEKIVKMPIADWLPYITPVQINNQFLVVFSLFLFLPLHFLFSKFFLDKWNYVGSGSILYPNAWAGHFIDAWSNWF